MLTSPFSVASAGAFRCSTQALHRERCPARIMPSREDQPMSRTVRLALGLALLGIGAVLPLGAVFVLETDWPTMVKSALAGVSFFGFEILAIPAVALMGKENFDRITVAAKRWIGSLKPAGDIGPTRHIVGLALFLAPLVPTYIMAYLPNWLPDNAPERLWVNILADAVFLISLFVLGGDFWDKLRALFVRQARVSFPAASGTGDLSQ
jgi:hypothetical protein